MWSALAGFGLDSLIEIGASVVVIWELSDANEHRQRQALRLIGVAFALLAVYLAPSDLGHERWLREPACADGRTGAVHVRSVVIPH